MKTLLDAKNSTIPNAIGINPCDPQFVSYINEAQERLAQAGKWWGSYQRMQVCATAGCIVWPREVMTVEGINVCNFSIPLRNGFYEFQENVRAPSSRDCNAQRILIDRGVTPLFRNILVASNIRLYPTDTSDEGKSIILQGFDSNGIPIRTNRGTVEAPDWIDGEEVVLTSPFAVSSNQFMPGGLRAVQKEATNNRVLVFGWDGTTESPLATWQPSETAPSYRLTYMTRFPDSRETSTSDCCAESACLNDAQIPNVTGEVTTNIVIGTDEGVAIGTDEGVLIGVGTSVSETTTFTCSGPSIVAMVRRQFIPALVDTDWLYISNIPALKFAVMSIRREEANEAAQAERFWGMAIRTLRNEIDAYVPPQKTIINVETQGTAPFSRVYGGFI